ncbi:EthD family reductase [Aeromicrobium wangtongii]|uniref:EthD family reductase n=1 Tax=Aeromicrobium wangtongii TaxID=2969247 RepID=UPI00201736B7|nr:EthD family reductase [Aeromicrobium wangtongii]MCL3817299.1 EthD family reductase [Aeromicrobium wangtongii]
MTTKITIIYDNPQDEATFEAGYPEQVGLAKNLPGLQRFEAAKVWPKEDGSPTPAYRLFDMYFEDYDAANAAVTTEEAAALFPKIFELATGGVRIVFADVEQG